MVDAADAMSAVLIRHTVSMEQVCFVPGQDAPSTYDFPGAIDGPTVEPFALVSCILDLQPRFYMLNWRRYHANSPPGHHACYGMTKGGKLCHVMLAGQLGLRKVERFESENGRAGEDVLVEHTTIKG